MMMGSVCYVQPCPKAKILLRVGGSLIHEREIARERERVDVGLFSEKRTYLRVVGYLLRGLIRVYHRCRWHLTKRENEWVGEESSSLAVASA